MWRPTRLYSQPTIAQPLSILHVDSELPRIHSFTAAVLLPGRTRSQQLLRWATVWPQ